MGYVSSACAPLRNAWTSRFLLYLMGSPSTEIFFDSPSWHGDHSIFEKKTMPPSINTNILPDLKKKPSNIGPMRG